MRFASSTQSRFANASRRQGTKRVDLLSSSNDLQIFSQLGRRDCLVGLLAGVGSLMATEAAMAAYGEAANVFGKRTDPSSLQF